MIMTTLLFVFISSLALALVLTPLVTTVALRCNLRQPTERCCHTRPLPRIGGVAMYLAFFLSLVFCLLLQTDISSLLYEDSRLAVIAVAATLIFCVGFWDDLRPLSPLVKLLAQLIAALITWLGGVQINVLSVSLTSGVELSWLSLPVTVFWIVLVVNAINFIDGLDGLAAGVSLFVSLIMLAICVITGKFLVALGFVALAGATLGFLRYNFNPASIFMGDSGSYFLGYIIASLSIFGSVKGQTTLAMLIPFIALGVPLFDALLAPMRRFVHGKNIFVADQGHLHHRLIKNGFSQRKTVLVLYGVTLLLGVVAFGLVIARDELAGFILLVLAATLFFAFRKLGYLHYFTVDKLYGWLRDMTEASGVSHDRRTFLDLQIQISTAQSLDEMWDLVGGALVRLDFDNATLLLSEALSKDQNTPKLTWHSKQQGHQIDATSAEEVNNNFTLKLTFPLVERTGRLYKRSPKSIGQDPVNSLGILILEKNIEKKQINHFTLRRVEQLRRIITRRLITAL